MAAFVPKGSPPGVGLPAGPDPLLDEVVRDVVTFLLSASNALRVASTRPGHVVAAPIRAGLCDGVTTSVR